MHEILVKSTKVGYKSECVNVIVNQFNREQLKFLKFSVYSKLEWFHLIQINQIVNI